MLKSAVPIKNLSNSRAAASTEMLPEFIKIPCNNVMRIAENKRNRPIAPREIKNGAPGMEMKTNGKIIDVTARLKAAQ